MKFDELLDDIRILLTNAFGHRYSILTTNRPNHISPLLTVFNDASLSSFCYIEIEMEFDTGVIHVVMSKIGGQTYKIFVPENILENYEN